MWHSLGSMKKFGYAMIDKEEGTPAQIAYLMKMHKNYNYALISSYSFIKDYVEGFNISENKILEIPLPRVDLLTDHEYRNKTRNNLICKYPFLKEKKNILYCPTFRKNEERMSSALSKLSEHVDFNKYNLIVSLHPLSNRVTLPNNVILLKENTFDLLFIADYLISDYSSVIYEAGLLNIPFCHYAYDWNTYKNMRELNIDLEKESPGLFTMDPSKIMEYIEKDNFDNENYQTFINKNVTLDGISSCKKIYNLIQRNIGDKNEHINVSDGRLRDKIRL